MGSCAGLVGVLCGVLCGASGPDCPDWIPEAFDLLGLVRTSCGEALCYQDFFKIGRALCHQDPPQDHFSGKSLVGVLCASWVYCAKSCGSLVRIFFRSKFYSIQNSTILKGMCQQKSDCSEKSVSANIWGEDLWPRPEAAAKAAEAWRGH